MAGNRNKALLCRVLTAATIACVGLGQGEKLVHAFSTFRGKADVLNAVAFPSSHDGFIHGEITRAILRPQLPYAPLLTEERSIRAVILANWRQDYDEMKPLNRPNASYNPAHHFDRNAERNDR